MCISSECLNFVCFYLFSREFTMFSSKCPQHKPFPFITIALCNLLIFSLSIYMFATAKCLRSLRRLSLSFDMATFAIQWMHAMSYRFSVRMEGNVNERWFGQMIMILTNGPLQSHRQKRMARKWNLVKCILVVGFWCWCWHTD